VAGPARAAVAPPAPVTDVGTAAGLEVSAHTLRHTAATRWLRAGVDVVVVAGLLGHSSLDTTRTYTNPRELHLPGEKPQVAC
jgi:site-specific recombinase XerD